MITDAQQIIDRAHAASVAQNLDDRGRLSYENGYLCGHIKELCWHIKFMEGEISEALAANNKLQSE